MKYKISEPITRVDHHEKITGTAKYVSDYAAAADNSPILTGHLARLMMFMRKSLIQDIRNLWGRG